MNEIPSIAASLFYGEVDEDLVFPYPEFNQEQKEMSKTMIDAINKFADDKIDSEKFDNESEIPEDVVKGLAELGLCGLGVPEEMGGLGLDHTVYARIFQEIAGIDGAVATMLGAHQSIGFKALLNEGTQEQKKKWLPHLASGEKFAAFCLTEPSSGSDAYSIKTKAVLNNDGDYVLNGQKLWITNGGYAEFYTVFCKTDHKEGGEVKEKVTALIVEKSFEGVSFGDKEDKMGIRGSETRAIFFENVIVPKENIIGELGKGFKVAMNVLNTGRLSLGSGCVGGMKAVLKLATDHAKNRKQFGQPIAEFGMIQDKLSMMAAMTYASESTVYFTTGLMDRGMKNFALESAICKVFCSEAIWQVVDQSLQVAAGNGYMREYPYERLLRDSRINLIFEGTNEILRCFIALMGVKGPSEELKKLGKLSDVPSTLSDPIKSLGLLGDFAKKRIGKMMTRSFTHVHEELEDEAHDVASMLGDFSIKVENALFKFGKKIIDRELTQKRIAEMAIHLYSSLAVLSRTSRMLESESVSEGQKEYTLNLARLALQRSRGIFKRNRDSMGSKQDRIIVKASNGVCDHDGYGLDIVDI